jgi:hypothetical protein
LLFVDSMDRHQDPLGSLDRGAVSERPLEVVELREAFSVSNEADEPDVRMLGPRSLGATPIGRADSAPAR